MDKKTYLIHHGIKGQKWGVRRYQNEDGTLTDAGKARYYDDYTPKKDPTKMTDKELANVNKRLGEEAKYKQLTGTTQPSRSFNRDTAIKIGASFIGTAALTFLARKWKNGTFAEHTGKTAKSKVAVGKTVTTALLAGGIGALVAATTSLGGQATERHGSYYDKNN